MKKKTYRLKKWAQTVYAVIGAVCFCFLVGLGAAEFSFTTIALIALALIGFGGSAHMLEKYGRID